MAPADPELTRFLASLRTVAVVGLSPSADRPSNGVARYLQGCGLRVLPVNPRITEALGEPSHESLEALPEVPDVVVVFRRPDEVPEVAEAAIRSGTRGLWLQLGIRHEEAEAGAAAAGLTVVSDRCIKQEFQRLLP